MKRWLFALGALLGLVALAACAAKEEAKPAPAAPGAILPRKDAWQEEWERVLAAAKQEGKVVVAGQAGTDRRRVLTEPFEKKYGITVEYMPDGRTLAQRIRTERDAGQYLWDIFIGGGNTPMQILVPVGGLDPIAPALILPEVKDPKKWQWGKGLRFFDPEERLLINMFAAKSPPIMFNPNVVRPGELTGFKDLLDPKWKGKMVADDPRVPGPGRAKWRFMAVQKDLGPDYMRALLKQEITFTRDEEGALRWVVAGQYPVCVGCSEHLKEPLERQGLPIRSLTPKEGIDITGGWGQIGLVNRAPHPNAAKLYLNWVLSQEGQTALLPATLYASWRTDVPTADLKPYQIPQETDTLLDTEPQQVKAEAIVTAIFKEFFGER